MNVGDGIGAKILGFEPKTQSVGKTVMRRILTPQATTVIRLAITAAVAFSLLYSGMLHLSQPYAFVHAAARYQLLPIRIIGLMILVPYVQIVLAACLLTGRLERTALVLTAGLFGIFACAQIAVLMRGDTISCGCFGFASETVGRTSLSIALAGSALCVLLRVWCPGQLPSPPADQAISGALQGRDAAARDPAAQPLSS